MLFSSFLDCRSLRDLSSNQLTGTVPPELGNLAHLDSLYGPEFHCLANVYYPSSTDFIINNCFVFAFIDCRSLSDLNKNQLNGTIPPELGRLTMATYLYAQSRIVLLNNI